MQTVVEPVAGSHASFAVQRLPPLQTIGVVVQPTVGVQASVVQFRPSLHTSGTTVGPLVALPLDGRPWNGGGPLSVPWTETVVHLGVHRTAIDGRGLGDGASALRGTGAAGAENGDRGAALVTRHRDRGTVAGVTYADGAPPAGVPVPGEPGAGPI